MTEENVKDLHSLLEKLGFGGRTAWEVETYMRSGVPSFDVLYSRTIENDLLQYSLRGHKAGDGNYAFDGYKLSLTRVEIPDDIIRDVDILALENSLKKVDTYYDLFRGDDWSDNITKQHYQQMLEHIEDTNASLERLASWKAGQEAARLLMYKYWPQSRYAMHYSDYKAMESRYKKEHYFPIDRENIITLEQSYHILKAIFMNEKNFEYLRDNLKYTGFGEGLMEALKEQMKAGAPNFHLSFDTEINKKAFSAVLSFRNSENTDMYFFNSYHATLTRSNGEMKDQAFYMNKGKGVTAKEAYNLLEGRAVYKELENREGQKYHAWLQIDFSKRDKSNNHELNQFHEAYGYDLKEALAKFPIRDMKEPDLRDILLSSLQKGNLQAVAFEKEGGAVRMFVEANPQYKTINLYDNELKRVPKEELQKYQVEGKDKVAGKEVGKDKDAKKEMDKSISTDKSQQSGDTKKGKAKDTKDLLPQKEGPGNKKGIKLT